MRLRFPAGVTLVGSGPLDRAALEAARAVAPVLVAADGAADRLAGWGEAPDALIGDMDSVADLAGWRDRLGDMVLHLAEQETTDLEKCLYSVEAPFLVGVGFLGGRLDHTLAALHGLMRWPGQPTALIGEEDLTFMAPRDLRLTLEPGARVSFFPVTPVRGLGSHGLVWPPDGLDFAPGVRIGTSNRAAAAQVSASFDAPGMACILERRFLRAALSALGADFPETAAP